MHKWACAALRTTTIHIKEAGRLGRIRLGECRRGSSWMSEATKSICTCAFHPKVTWREIDERLSRVTKLAVVTVLALVFQEENAVGHRFFVHGFTGSSY